MIFQEACHRCRAVLAGQPEDAIRCSTCGAEYTMKCESWLEPDEPPKPDTRTPQPIAKPAPPRANEK
jgi:hypothetical protein